jgi:uncharacterized protein with FMN-binding domain
MKRIILIALTAVMAVMMLSGCFVENEPVISTADAWGDPPFNGEVNGMSNRGYGGNITVTLSFADGIIKTINITHFESDGYGKTLIERAKPFIVKANSFDPVDSLSGATFTKDALKEAGKIAFNKIPGVSIP